MFLGSWPLGATPLHSSKSDTALRGGARFQEPLVRFALPTSGGSDPTLPCWLGRVSAGGGFEALISLGHFSF